jgi:hypothetical protein
VENANQIKHEALVKPSAARESAVKRGWIYPPTTHYTKHNNNMKDDGLVLLLLVLVSLAASGCCVDASPQHGRFLVRGGRPG